MEKHEPARFSRSNPKKRVAVLAHALSTAGGLAVGTNLLRGMAQARKDWDYLITVPPGVGYEGICGSFKSKELVWVPRQDAARRLIFDGVKLPRIVSKFEPDLVLALDSSMGLVNPPAPQAVLVHAPHLLYPRSSYGPTTIYGRLRHNYLKSHFRRELARTELIFAQTEVVAQRIVKNFSYPGKIVVIGTSVAPSLFEDHQTQAPSVMQASGSSLRLLYPSRYYPHKNVEGVIQTFDRFRDELSDVKIFFTFTANQHPLARRALKKIHRLNLSGNLITLGHLPEPELAAAYREADGLFQPTLLETYGIPYVEAMAVGRPILTSDLDFAKAVCGEAALYFDPWNQTSMKNAILRFRDEPDLREEVARRGLRRARESNTWTDISSTVIKAMESLNGSGGIS